MSQEQNRDKTRAITKHNLHNIHAAKIALKSELDIWSFFVSCHVIT